MKEKSVQTTAPKSHSRRKFMSQVGFTGAAALATGAVGAKPLFAGKRDRDRGDDGGSNQRAEEC